MRYESLISSCVLCQIFVQSCQTVDNDVYLLNVYIATLRHIDPG